MCRGGSGTRWLAVLLVACTVGAARGDDVADYLARRDLDQLLAVHLQNQIERTRGAEREALVLQLADLYAQLLEGIDDEKMRDVVEQRSRDLLSLAPADGADDLRFALLRGSYRSAEKVAERHRLRLADDDEVEQALATLGEVIPQLQRLQTRVDTSADRLSGRLARAVDRSADDLANKVDRAIRLSGQCRFVTAWALYYHAWLRGQPEDAAVAERLFTRIIDRDASRLDPQDVSVDLRGVESVARSILGMGLCKAVTDRTEVAIRWIVLLEHPRTFEPLREQTTAWKIAIYLDRGEYLPVLELLSAEDEGDVPLGWLRLAAALALEDERGSRYALELAQLAVTRMASRGELDQVLDLAKRYGIESLGGSGFAIEYVGGALEYHEARTEHQNDEPTTDTAIAARYREAARRLARALETTDVDRYREAAVGCRRLIASSLFFAGDFVAAHAAFLDAADALPITESADPLWMAIVSLDEGVQRRVAGADEAAMDALIERFLRDHPSHEYAPRLVLKRAARLAEATPDEAIEDLLAIPVSSDVYEAARNQAAQILFERFRGATGADRVAYAGRYISVALSLKSIDEDRDVDRDSTVLVRLVGRCLRLLEVSLADDVGRLVAARSAIETLDGLAETDEVASHASEIEYRRMQLLMRHDDLPGARRIADTLYTQEGLSNRWARFAGRAMFQDAHRRWRRLDETDPAHRGATADVIKYGVRVLEEIEGDPNRRDDDRTLAYVAAVAEAAMDAWDRSGDVERGRLALRLYRDRLLAARPSNAGFLRATAVLSGVFDDDAVALDCWRRLVAGLPAEDLGWFEARYHVLEILVEQDVDLAMPVMEQHRLLHPDYGPPPWGDRLRELDERLRSLATERTEDAS